MTELQTTRMLAADLVSTKQDTKLQRFVCSHGNTNTSGVSMHTSVVWYLALMCSFILTPAGG